MLSGLGWLSKTLRLSALSMGVLAQLLWFFLARKTAAPSVLCLFFLPSVYIAYANILFHLNVVNKYQGVSKVFAIGGSNFHYGVPLNHVSLFFVEQK
jgi:hypothetical protein